MGRTSHTLVYFLMSLGASYDSDTVPSSDDEEMEDLIGGRGWKLNPNPSPWSGTLADSHAWQMETLESLRGAKESSPPVPPD